jgi:hypothetical protein
MAQGSARKITAKFNPLVLGEIHAAGNTLALIGREGLMGMIGVDKIGEIRRAYFEQGRSIKG